MKHTTNEWVTWQRRACTIFNFGSRCYMTVSLFFQHSSQSNWGAMRWKTMDTKRWFRGQPAIGEMERHPVEMLCQNGQSMKASFNPYWDQKQTAKISCFLYLWQKCERESVSVKKIFYGCSLSVRMKISKQDLWSYFFQESAHNRSTKRLSKFLKTLAQASQLSGNGWPSDVSSTEKVQEVVLLLTEDHRQTVKKLTKKTDTSVGSTHTILFRNLDNRKKLQCWQNTAISGWPSQGIIERGHRDPRFLRRIGASDKTWVCS